MPLTTVIANNLLTEVGLKLALRRIAVSVSKDTVIGKSVGLVSCLRDCADYIHRDNRERGWWTNLHTGQPLDRNVGELLMLMVSEVAEIPRCAFAAVEIDDKLPDRLMFEVELADTAIRIFDTVGALSPKFADGYVASCMELDHVNNGTYNELDSYLMAVVRELALAMEFHRKGHRYNNEIAGFDYHLGRALHAVFYTGAAFGLHVAEAICDKLDFNRRREDHKPEHRKAEGGKAY